MDCVAANNEITKGQKCIESDLYDTATQFCIQCQQHLRAAFLLAANWCHTSGYCPMFIMFIETQTEQRQAVFRPVDCITLKLDGHCREHILYSLHKKISRTFSSEPLEKTDR